MQKLREKLIQHLVSWHKMTELEASVAVNELDGTILSSEVSKEQGKMYISLSVSTPHVCGGGCGRVA